MTTGISGNSAIVFIRKKAIERCIEGLKKDRNELNNRFYRKIVNQEEYDIEMQKISKGIKKATDELNELES